MGFSEAVEALLADQRERGAIPTQPSEAASDLVNGVWYMRSAKGFLGRVSAASGKVF